MRARVRSRRRAAVQQQRLDEVLHLPCPSKWRVLDPRLGAGVGTMVGPSAMWHPTREAPTGHPAACVGPSVCARVHLGGAHRERARRSTLGCGGG